MFLLQYRCLEANRRQLTTVGNRRNYYTVLSRPTAVHWLVLRATIYDNWLGPDNMLWTPQNLYLVFFQEDWNSTGSKFSSVNMFSFSWIVYFSFRYLVTGKSQINIFVCNYSVNYSSRIWSVSMYSLHINNPAVVHPK